MVGRGISAQFKWGERRLQILRPDPSDHPIPFPSPEFPARRAMNPFRKGLNARLWPETIVCLSSHRTLARR